MAESHEVRTFVLNIHATYMSAWNEKPIHIDFDAEEYEKELDDNITQE